jgi:hypothetical protein
MGRGVKPVRSRVGALVQNKANHFKFFNSPTFEQYIYLGNSCLDSKMYGRDAGGHCRQHGAPLSVGQKRPRLVAERDP